MQSLRFPRFYHYKNVRIGDFVLRQKLFRQLCTAHILKKTRQTVLNALESPSQYLPNRIPHFSIPLDMKQELQSIESK